MCGDKLPESVGRHGKGGYRASAHKVHRPKLDFVGKKRSLGWTADLPLLSLFVLDTAERQRVRTKFFNAMQDKTGADQEKAVEVLRDFDHATDWSPDKDNPASVVNDGVCESTPENNVLLTSFH